MTIKREAAYHEAGHAILAERSKYHRFLGPAILSRYGSGAANISLSNQKLQAAGKKPHADSARDKDVAKDLAVILAAGLVAEWIAAEKDSSLTPNSDCAAPDHDLLREQLGAAGLSRKFDIFEAQARTLLEQDWSTVEAIVEHLMQHHQADHDDIERILGSNDV